MAHPRDARGGRTAVLTAALEEIILWLLRIPPRPQPPPGHAGSVRVFRAARRYLDLNLVRWGLQQLGTLAGLVVGLGFLQAVPFRLPWVFTALEALGVALFVAQLPFTLVLVIWDYRLRWYVVTDRSLRLREGVWTIRERTMSFSNIQNLAIRQGPLQRLFGISDLEVRSAGGGGGSDEEEERHKNLHLAYFRGVVEAEEIRDAILERVRGLRDSGLGDPEEAAPARQAYRSRTAIRVAGEVLAEVRALRRRVGVAAGGGATAVRGEPPAGSRL